MSFNRQSILTRLRRSLSDNASWSQKLSRTNANDFGLHIAIFREPYLSFIMDGRKTVETRFAKRPCPPFERVEDGDVVLLKPVGRPVVGVCEVDKVWFYHLDPAALKSIKERFGKLICPVDGRFWSERQSKSV